jgi:membrane protease subunit HflC
MKKFSAFLGLPFVLVLLVLLGNTFFIVSEGRQVLVTQFGQIQRIINEPGLHCKIPFLEGIAYYDKRILDYDLPAFEVTAGDQKRLVVDIFTRYKIVDPLKFYKTVNTEVGLQNRLVALIPGQLRSVIGSFPLTSLLTVERTKIMSEIREKVNEAVTELGVYVVDFRIRRADLPAQNNEAIFARMISDRQKEAQEFRAKGAETAQLIRAQTDKDKVIVLSQAKKQAEILKGEGTAKAAEVLSQIYSKDPEFFKFYQSLESYKNTFDKDSETTIVLGTDHRFLRYWNDINRS